MQFTQKKRYALPGLHLLISVAKRARHIALSIWYFTMDFQVRNEGLGSAKSEYSGPNSLTRYSTVLASAGIS